MARLQAQLTSEAGPLREESGGDYKTELQRSFLPHARQQTQDSHTQLETTALLCVDHFTYKI